MNIKVKVIPNSKKNSVVEENGVLKVHVSAQAVDGKANKMLIEVLAEYFNTKKGNIKIVRGLKCREKIVKVD